METVADSKVEHLKWIDVLKGLGILTVVWGHSGSQNSFYMFWFHMPLFFLVSGYLYRFNPQQTGIAYVQRKAKHLLVPYVFYLLLITLMMLSLTIWRGQSVGQFFSDNWLALLLGGSLLEGVYATFWFITCLFFVQITYDYLCRKVPSSFYKGTFIVGCFFIAYWESRYFPESFVPWNADVAFYAIVFYALGHFVKQSKLLEKTSLQAVVFGLSMVIVIGFSLLFSYQILDFGLDMKHRQYYYFGTNLIVPLTFTLLLILLSMILAKCPFINNALIGIGKAAMVIMYLHISAVYIAGQIVTITPMRFLVIGILVPLIFYKFIKIFTLGRRLGLGEFKGNALNRLVSRVELKG